MKEFSLVTIESLKEYLINNVSVLKDLVSEINSWDGSLDYLEYYNNDEEFFNVFFASNPSEAVRATYYGDYNYMDDYVKFNGYGNLESCSEYDFEEELKSNVDEIIDRAIDEKDNIYIYDEDLKNMLDNLEI